MRYNSYPLTHLGDNQNIVLGTSDVAATALRIQYSTVQTNGAGMIGVDETSRTLHICDYTDLAYDFALAAQTHPCLAIHSKNQSATQYMTFQHNGTNALYTVPSGTHLFDSNDVAITTATDRHLLMGGGGQIQLRTSSTFIRESTGLQLSGGGSNPVYTSSNVVIGAGAAGATAAKVLALHNSATAPTTSVDLVQLYGVDLSAGNATLGIFTETAVVSEVVVSDATLSIKHNGTTYKVLLKT